MAQLREYKNGTSPAPKEPPIEISGPLTVALVGAPYVGKTTLFNFLTGLSQYPIHRPEDSVDLRSGSRRWEGRTLEFVDLPSSYTLGSGSADETACRDFVAGENPDVVVVVINAANLEGTLYLLSEVLELPSPVVVAVTMMDVAARQGASLETEVLQAALGVPVVPVSVARGGRVDNLIETVVSLAEGRLQYSPKRPVLSEGIEDVLSQVAGSVAGSVGLAYPERWLAVKLLEGDRELTQTVQADLAPEDWSRLQGILARNEGAVVGIATARYEWIERMVRAAVVKPRHGAVSLTEKLDRVATHALLGPALLLAILAVLFWAVYQIAGPMVSLLDQWVGAASSATRGALATAPPWVVGIVVDGMLGGVGTVLSLLPILVVFFLGMALLQNVGYMSRAAFVADRFMHAMGLHGESLIPLFLGFGCNVPAVFGARLIQSPRARLLTILVTPLVPCTGRMVVLVFMAGAMFGSAAPLVTWGLVALNLGLLAATGIFIDRAVLHSERPALIMELPLYHMPTWRAIALETWQSTKDFIVRAGTIILLVSLVVWVLANLPAGNIQDSYLAQAGRLLEPVGSLMGLDWRMMVALLTSFVAKENALATMAVLLNSGEDTGLVTALPQILAPASALAYLVLQITFIPCVSTVTAMHREIHNLRWIGFALGYLLLLSLAAGVIAFQGARLLGWGV